ncbi:type II toxin-antitoxin system VapC family toxin [Sphingomonas japonica]|uniref:PIN domain nuclease of toxin-antitoxin system n=1 Tax=Sphingomonas japonica TaxID=511662 RepID=A0ABX0TWD7_9SPHN|nr:type II toxin-antitoxin system VapC family toxin [Sphingomonas japonica]NIJ22629.1 PIN domain nuclease of toxin-antitoxin system [Sphingomonas japonica]
MSYLLDTHALLWWWLDDRALPGRAIEAIKARSQTVFVSPVSALEIAIKVRIGRLDVMREPLERFDELVSRDALTQLPISYVHARHAGLLPGVHRDPFDRLIAAQALIEGLTVITRDREISRFGCKVLWE